MPAQLLQGAPLAEKIRQELAPQVELLKRKGFPLKVAAIQAGDDPSSLMYIRQQEKAFLQAGIGYEFHQLPGQVSLDEMLQAVAEANRNESVTGIILQTPFPAHLPQDRLQESLSPDKDIEGIHPRSLGRIVYGSEISAPCTALAALMLLKETGRELKGMEAVILGRSEIVGTPLALLLLKTLKSSPTVTVCHTGTRDLEFHIRRADVLIACVGRPCFVNGKSVKEGAIVIDVGTHRVPDVDAAGAPILDDQGRPRRKTVGDVETEAAAARASFITPVPGGVGPLTVAMLLRKTVLLAKALHHL